MDKSEELVDVHGVLHKHPSEVDTCESGIYIGTPEAEAAAGSLSAANASLLISE
jgi:hypothetical protein